MTITVQITKVEGGFTIMLPETERTEARIAVASTARQAGKRAGEFIEKVLSEEEVGRP